MLTRSGWVGRDDQQVRDVDEIGLGDDPDAAVLAYPLGHIQQLCYSQQPHPAAPVLAHLSGRQGGWKGVGRWVIDR